jgi:hypothetical protein
MARYGKASNGIGVVGVLSVDARFSWRMPILVKRLTSSATSLGRPVSA